jgi:hypothetical protein
MLIMQKRHNSQTKALEHNNDWLYQINKMLFNFT